MVCLVSNTTVAHIYTSVFILIRTLLSTLIVGVRLVLWKSFLIISSVCDVCKEFYLACGRKYLIWNLEFIYWYFGKITEL